MRILIADIYYTTFLDNFYAEANRTSEMPYETQWRELMATGFGTANYYSRNLMKLGHEAHEIVFNAAPLQRQWVREHGIKLREKEWRPFHKRWHGIPVALRRNRQRWPYEILAEQIKNYQPDILHVQDMNTIHAEFIREIKSNVRLVVGQTAYALRNGADYRGFDLILTSLPHYVVKFRELGLKSELFRLGFEPDILKEMKKAGRPYEATHIGGYRAIHRERNEVLEKLIGAGIDLQCWGYGLEELPETSAIRRCYRGEAWGLEMHKIRHNSKVVVSRHVSSVANVHANIMTLYEATGVGSLLAIDMRNDLGELFEPDKEVLAYNSPDECVEKVKYYLEHEAERLAIAKAGQDRTLQQHTYFHRMQEYMQIVGEYL
jgi:spore maturation protein CgeB